MTGYFLKIYISILGINGSGKLSKSETYKSFVCNPLIRSIFKIPSERILFLQEL